MAANKAKQASKASELRTKTDDQLKDRLVELKKGQFNLRFQQASGQLENTAQMRQMRREVAAIKTIMGQRARATA